MFIHTYLFSFIKLRMFICILTPFLFYSGFTISLHSISNSSYPMKASLVCSRQRDSCIADYSLALIVALTATVTAAYTAQTVKRLLPGPATKKVSLFSLSCFGHPSMHPCIVFSNDHAFDLDCITTINITILHLQ